MIVDTSALLAVVFDEHDADRFIEALTDATRPRMASASWFEAAMVVDSRANAQSQQRFGRFVESLGIDVVAFTVEHGLAARVAWQLYGRGRHKARLNFGDCMAYALAKMEKLPLLYKGDDFVHTDIEPALKP